MNAGLRLKKSNIKERQRQTQRERDRERQREREKYSHGGYTIYIFVYMLAYVLPPLPRARLRPLSCEPHRYIWQFNFREFAPSRDMHAAESIHLLSNSGIDFDANTRMGVDAKRFAELLMVSGIVLNDDVRWITFHSAYDFGYLVKLVTCRPLDEEEEAFMETLCTYFPHVYDMKHLMRYCDGLRQAGGLARLADLLGVGRVGAEHQAGSDSLLTSAAFFKMREVFATQSEKTSASVRMHTISDEHYAICQNGGLVLAQ